MRYLLLLLLFPSLSWGEERRELALSSGRVSTYSGMRSLATREASRSEKNSYKQVLRIIREARKIHIPPKYWNVTSFLIIANLHKKVVVREAQWTIGNCHNVDHWPELQAAIPRFEMLARAIEDTSPTLLTKGSYYCPERRCWIVAKAPKPDWYERPEILVKGSMQPDARFFLPTTQNQELAAAMWQEIVSSLK